jgi:hypothetical protein
MFTQLNGDKHEVCFFNKEMFNNICIILPVSEQKMGTTRAKKNEARNGNTMMTEFQHTSSSSV